MPKTFRLGGELYVNDELVGTGSSKTFAETEPTASSNLLVLEGRTSANIYIPLPSSNLEPLEYILKPILYSDNIITTELDKIVYASIADTTSGNVYIGGEFTETDTNFPLNYVGVIKNSELLTNLLPDENKDNNGTNGPVRDLSLDSSNSKLYIGGQFSTVGGSSVFHHVGQYDITTGYHTPLLEPVSNITGVNNNVYAVEYNNSNVYIGGDFRNFLRDIGSVNGNANSIAVYNTNNQTWSDMGIDFTSGGGNLKQVITINGYGSNLYVGGVFSRVNVYPTSSSTDANCIAVYNTSSNTWSNLFDSSGGVYGVSSSNGGVQDILEYNSNLYVAGTFTELSNGGTANYFVKYDLANQTWSVPLQNVFALTSSVYSLARIGSNVYLGGSFAGKVLRYDTSSSNTYSFFADTSVFDATFTAFSLLVDPIDNTKLNVFMKKKLYTIVDGLNGYVEKTDMKTPYYIENSTIAQTYERPSTDYIYDSLIYSSIDWQLINYN